MVVLLHTIFKGLALTIYLGSSFIMNSFIASFIFIMMLLSADFWVVKNVCGRLLAGLRWWSVATETGGLVWRWWTFIKMIILENCHWRYESWTPEERSLAQAGESTLFWMVLIGNQTIWTLLAFMAVFKWVFNKRCAILSHLAGCPSSGWSSAASRSASTALISWATPGPGWAPPRPCRDGWPGGWWGMCSGDRRSRGVSVNEKWKCSMY